MNIKLLSLYPDLLNLYGEYANLSVLSRCLKEEGADITVISAVPGEPIPSDADFVYIGCGTESASIRALGFLREQKKVLQSYLDRDTPFLATGNSFELFGRTIHDDRNGVHDGLGFFAFETARTHEKRYLSDAIMTTPLISEKIIGFINKCSTVTGVETPMMKTEMGYGNDNVSSGEGIISGSFYGTSLIGPLLIRNPALCRYFLGIIAEKAGFKPAGAPLMDLQDIAYGYALSALTERL